MAHSTFTGFETMVVQVYSHAPQCLTLWQLSVWLRLVQLISAHLSSALFCLAKFSFAHLSSALFISIQPGLS